METKKKLRKDLEEVKAIVFGHNKTLSEILPAIMARLTALEKKAEEEANMISSKIAAKMLGWHSDKVSSTFLTRHGITFTKDENNILHISKEKLAEYIEKRGAETNKE